MCFLPPRCWEYIIWLVQVTSQMSHLDTCFLKLNSSPNDNASYLKESDPCIDTVFKVATLDPLSSSCISSSSTATVTIWSSSSYTKRRSRIHQRYFVKIVNNCISLLLLNSTAMLTSSKMVKFHVRGHHAISNSLLLNIWINDLPLKECTCSTPPSSRHSPISSLISSRAWYIFFPLDIHSHL